MHRMACKNSSTLPCTLGNSITQGQQYDHDVTHLAYCEQDIIQGHQRDHETHLACHERNTTQGQQNHT